MICTQKFLQLLLPMWYIFACRLFSSLSSNVKVFDWVTLGSKHTILQCEASISASKKIRFESKSRCYCHCSAALLGCFDSKLFFKHGNRSLVGNINTILQYATSVSACGANVGVGLGLCSPKDANLKHKKRQI